MQLWVFFDWFVCLLEGRVSNVEEHRSKSIRNALVTSSEGLGLVVKLTDKITHWLASVRV